MPSADALPRTKSRKASPTSCRSNSETLAPRNVRRSATARHLLRHGVTTELHSFTREDPDVAGSAILSFSAADCGARLIVMGGYGHSRTREVLFGGATRGVLESMTVPVLMSH